MRHADISAALDALGAQYGITQLHRPNYAGGRVNVQLTTTERPVIGISLDEALFTLKDRDTLADTLEDHFENVSKLLCGAQIVNACTNGVEPVFQLDALPIEKRREVCDSLARVFLALSEGDAMKDSRQWLHQRLGLFPVPMPAPVCDRCGKPTEDNADAEDRRDGAGLCWCPPEDECRTA